MSLKSEHEVAINQEFRERLKMALIHKALAVMTDEKSPDGHRYTAGAILRNPDSIAEKISFLVAATGMTDYNNESAIFAAVDSIWDKVPNY